MSLCVCPWARLEEGDHAHCGSAWTVPEETPPEASVVRQPSQQQRVGGGAGIRRLLSGLQGSKRPRAMVALSVVSVYLLAAFVGYATLRGGGVGFSGHGGL